MLQQLQEANLTAKPVKCKLGMQKTLYLGYVVGNDVIHLAEDKVKSILQIAQPKTKKEVRSFLGLVSYYRQFIPQMAEIATSLSDCTKKGAPNEVVWTQECDQAFRTLKDQLASKPVFQSPDFDKEFILQTDASGRGLGGAVLSQVGPDGQEFPEQKTAATRTKYAAVELECLAIVWVVQTLHVYLDGRRFTLETDHRALSYVQQMVNKADCHSGYWFSSHTTLGLGIDPEGPMKC